MAAISQRARILDGYKDRIQALFGPGTAANYFRSVTRRPWMPNAAVRDCATVVDTASGAASPAAMMRPAASGSSPGRS